LVFGIGRAEARRKGVEALKAMEVPEKNKAKQGELRLNKVKQGEKIIGGTVNGQGRIIAAPQAA
jgi:hypothetical protein